MIKFTDAERHRRIASKYATWKASSKSTGLFSKIDDRSRQTVLEATNLAAEEELILASDHSSSEWCVLSTRRLMVRSNETHSEVAWDEMNGVSVLFTEEADITEGNQDQDLEPSVLLIRSISGNTLRVRIEPMKSLNAFYNALSTAERISGAHVD